MIYERSMSKRNYMRWPWLVAMACLLMHVNGMLVAAPIDEFRLSDIENQLRDLQNQVREQARLIAQLQTARGQSVAPLPSANPVRTINANDLRWLSVSAWQKVKPGLGELAVIEILGAPTQMRSDQPQQRQLLYALEIGRSGFLSGKVTLENGAVTAVEVPSLR